MSPYSCYFHQSTTIQVHFNEQSSFFLATVSQRAARSFSTYKKASVFLGVILKINSKTKIVKNPLV